MASRRARATLQPACTRTGIPDSVCCPKRKAAQACDLLDSKRSCAERCTVYSTSWVDEQAVRRSVGQLDRNRSIIRPSRQRDSETASRQTRVETRASSSHSLTLALPILWLGAPGVLGPRSSVGARSSHARRLARCSLHAGRSPGPRAPRLSRVVCMRFAMPVYINICNRVLLLVPPCVQYSRNIWNYYCT
jgi:hypothetical protein